MCLVEMAGLACLWFDVQRWGALLQERRVLNGELLTFDPALLCLAALHHERRIERALRAL